MKAKIPNIKLTGKEYNKLVFQTKIYTGGEGIICLSAKNSLYKIFTEYQSKIPIGLSDNKYSKIKELYSNPIEYMIRPLSTISLDGELIGYEMTYDKDDIDLYNAKINKKQLITSLQQTSEILKYFASRDITYGDVKANNILLNKKTGQLKFCDIDNIRLGEYPIDLLHDQIDSIVLDLDAIDETVDMYMHNLMTLQLLHDPKYDYDEILYNLSEGKYKEYYEKAAQETLDSMTEPAKFTKEYIIQYIKR